jgi:hypothetical protein
MVEEHAHRGHVLLEGGGRHLTIQQTSKVELIINIKTAKALGLTVPPSLIASRRSGD